jgi:hypothetical protein
MPRTVPDPLRTHPRNEAELLAHRPPGYRYGAFPRALLLPGERVVYEGRPVLTTSHRWALGFFGSQLTLSTVVLLAVFALLPSLPTWQPDVPILLAAGIATYLVYGVPLYLVLLSWTRTAFALTDRRVLIVHGLLSSTFEFAYLGEVQGLDPPHTPTADLTFRIESISPPDVGAVKRPLRSVLVWPAVGHAPRTYEFLQSAFALGSENARHFLERIQKREWMRSGHAVCAYCGHLVATARSDRADGSCPRCSAPLATALEWGSVEEPRETPSSTVALLRPSVHLGREAIEWSRPMLLAWAIFLLGLPLLFLLPSGFTSSTGTTPATTVLVVLLIFVAPVFYLLVYQAVRKWGTAVRTLSASLPPDSPWVRGVLRPLQYRLRVTRVAVAASLGAVVGCVVVFAWLFTQASPVTGLPPANGVLLFDAVLGGFALSLAGGFVALFRAFSGPIAGSEVPEVDRPVRRGLQLALAGIPLGLLPIVPIVLGITFFPQATPSVLWFYVAPAGPLLSLLGLTLVRQGYDEWIWRADRLTAPGSAESLPPTPEILRKGAFGYVDAAGVPLRRAAVSATRQVAALPRGLRMAGVLLVVAVVVVSAIDVTGYQLLPGLESSGILTFRQAAAEATASADGFGAGPWSVIAAETVDYPVAISLPTHSRVPPGSDVPGLWCYATQVGHASSITLPASPGGTTLGAASGWLVTLQNTSGGGAVVSLDAGSAQVVDTYDFALCLHGAPGGLDPTGIPGNGLDSPAAINAVLFSGGRQFLADHPGANLTLSVTGGYIQGNRSHGAAFLVDLTTCPPSTVGTGAGVYRSPQYFANVNTTSGDLSGTPITGEYACN